MFLTFVRNKQIVFFRLYKVTHNVLQHLEKVVNDQCELKNTDFNQNISNHYPTFLGCKNATNSWHLPKGQTQSPGGRQRAS